MNYFRERQILLELVNNMCAIDKREREREREREKEKKRKRERKKSEREREREKLGNRVVLRVRFPAWADIKPFVVIEDLLFPLVSAGI